MREKMAEWLAERGLAFNEEKTRVVHLSEGFDFLGWNFRRYPGPKLLIKPSKAAVGKHRRRLAGETRRLRGANAGMVIATLNPVIRGWALPGPQVLGFYRLSPACQAEPGIPPPLTYRSFSITVRAR